jgi:hypothetical protein
MTALLRNLVGPTLNHFAFGHLILGEIFPLIEKLMDLLKSVTTLDRFDRYSGFPGM